MVKIPPEISLDEVFEYDPIGRVEFETIDQINNIVEILKFVSIKGEKIYL